MRIKLHKNSLKLAGIYLLILMFISLLFSANVYKLSSDEFRRGLRTPPGRAAIFDELPSDLEQQARDEFRQERLEQYSEAKNHMLKRLILVNLFILAGGGALSYYFAVRTLRPIEEAHEAQSRFTADASHELRTPLTAMRAETEVALMDSKLTLPKARRILESNVEELDRLTGLTEGLLMLAQGENGALHTKSELLSPVIQTAVDKVLPLAEKKHILINFSPVEKIKVQGEQASLAEAFVVLLDNAIKYSPEKTEVTVSITQESKCVFVKITDQGMGIKSSELPHIFDRFYRADSARSKQSSGGYGLGLAIAKNIIDKHRGNISVNSKTGEGTTFTVQLPRS